MVLELSKGKKNFKIVRDEVGSTDISKIHKGLFKYYVITYREGELSRSITIDYKFIEGMEGCQKYFKITMAMAMGRGA